MGRRKEGGGMRSGEGDVFNTTHDGNFGVPLMDVLSHTTIEALTQEMAL